MTKREAERYMRLCNALGAVGFEQDEIDSLLRDSRVLSTWAEHECNGEIQRDDESYIVCSRGDCGKTSYVDAAVAKKAPCPVCGDVAPLTRYVASGLPYWYNTNTGKRCGRTADREAEALRRIKTLCDRHGVTFYQQGDPRGCALYVIRPGDIPAGQDVGGYYDRGVAVCVD